MKMKCFLWIVAVLGAFPAQAQTRQKIARAADVPQFQYTVKGKVEELVKSEDLFRPFAGLVRRNIESVLRDFDIDDAATRRDLLGTLVALDVLEGRDGEASKRLDEIRSLEEKPASKLMSGLVTRAILAARSGGADRNSEAYRQAVSKSVRTALEAMPFDVVQNDVKNAKASMQIATADLVVGQLRAMFDPVVEKTGGLSSDMAHGIPGMRLLLVERLPLKETLTEALSAYLAAHTKEKKDIWAERNVTLDPGKNYAPVNVAVWDSGVDLNIFGEHVVKEASGSPAVIAYDLESRKTTGSLFPLNQEQMRRYPEAKGRMKGLSDMQANLDSPEANDLRALIAKLKPDEVRPFIEELSLFSIYAHGTHVAGIFLAGNPYARVLAGRLTFDHKMIPDPCPSRELMDRAAAAARDYVDFFKRNGVRVVNMSWGGSVKEVEGDLEKCAMGKTGDERKQIARQFFEIEKVALEQAMHGAPEILFIAAAGNSNTDSSFGEFIPSSLRLENLLTVGAVDKAGDEASFTSYGPTVAVHANGYEVESYIPGGDKLKMSGTSMASPNAANLAAKILAVNPKLKPKQVIDLIRNTAERSEDGRRNLINPKKALAAANQPG